MSCEVTCRCSQPPAATARAVDGEPDWGAGWMDTLFHAKSRTWAGPQLSHPPMCGLYRRCVLFGQVEAVTGSYERGVSAGLVGAGSFGPTGAVCAQLLMAATI